jgi:hypothetical protein
MMTPMIHVVPSATMTIIIPAHATINKRIDPMIVALNNRSYGEPGRRDNLEIFSSEEIGISIASPAIFYFNPQRPITARKKKNYVKKERILLCFNNL